MIELSTGYPTTEGIEAALQRIVRTYRSQLFVSPEKTYEGRTSRAIKNKSGSRRSQLDKYNHEIVEIYLSPPTPMTLNTMGFLVRVYNSRYLFG
jgi:hypothetical protein